MNNVRVAAWWCCYNIHFLVCCNLWVHASIMHPSPRVPHPPSSTTTTTMAVCCVAELLVSPLLAQTQMLIPRVM
jgi:hypothetical protein